MAARSQSGNWAIFSANLSPSITPSEKKKNHSVNRYCVHPRNKKVTMSCSPPQIRNVLKGPASVARNDLWDCKHICQDNTQKLGSSNAKIRQMMQLRMSVVAYSLENHCHLATHHFYASHIGQARLPCAALFDVPCRSCIVSCVVISAPDNGFV